jgi:hypothetical protein
VLHVANVCFKYFKCLRGMLQVFHLDIAKVDPNVAYVCCKCFIWMLHMFHTYVASVCFNYFQKYAASSVSCCKHILLDGTA